MATRSKIVNQVAAGRKVDLNGNLTVPIGGNLENRRPAQPAMREEQVLAEHMPGRASGGHYWGRDSRQIGPTLTLSFTKDKWNQSGAWRHDLQSKLPCQVVAERSRADFGNG